MPSIILLMLMVASTSLIIISGISGVSIIRLVVLLLMLRSRVLIVRVIIGLFLMVVRSGRGGRWVGKVVASVVDSAVGVSTGSIDRLHGLFHLGFEQTVLTPHGLTTGKFCAAHTGSAKVGLGLFFVEGSFLVKATVTAAAASQKHGNGKDGKGNEDDGQDDISSCTPR